MHWLTISCVPLGSTALTTTTMTSTSTAVAHWLRDLLRLAQVTGNSLPQQSMFVFFLALALLFIVAHGFFAPVLHTDPCASDSPFHHAVFVYDLPVQFVSTDDCAEARFGEVAWRLLMKNAAACRTVEPRSAQLFFVPFDALCLKHQWRTLQSPDVVEHRINALFVELLMWLRARPYFAMWPERHVFPMLSPRGPLLFTNWHQLSSSISLVPVEFSVNGAFNRTQHVVVPTFVADLEPLRQEAAKWPAGDESARPTRAFFAGALTNDLRKALSHAALLNQTTISVLVDSLLESHNNQFRRMLTRALFCLLVRGDVDHVSTLSALELNVHQRLVAHWAMLEEMVTAQCVPAILCDRCALPFAELIDWRAFTLKVDEEYAAAVAPLTISERIERAWNALGPEQREQIRGALVSVAPLLTFPPKRKLALRQFVLEPSPLTSLLHTLLARRRTKANG